MHRPCRSPRTAPPIPASARRCPRRSAARRPRSSPPAAPRGRSRRGRSPRRGRRATPSPSGSPRRRRWRRRSRAGIRSAAAAPAASGSPARHGRRCAWRACRARASPRAARRPAPGGRAEAAATHGSSGAGRRAGTDRTTRTGTAHASTTGSPTRGCLDPVADLLDDAGSLVAEQHRERRSPVPVLDRPQVRMADAARHQPDEHLARTRRVDLELLDPDARPRSRPPRRRPTSRDTRSPFGCERLMLASASPMDVQSASRPHPRRATPSSSKRSRPWSTSTAVRTRRRA